MAYLWESCLPGKEQEAKILLCNSREISQLGPIVNGCRQEEINVGLPGLGLAGTWVSVSREMVGFPAPIR